MVQRPESDTERKQRRIDLSLPQVAGSAMAAVAAAVMASQLGVYGTILGAGVMSVVATCGGSVFQHFFRRTGEQIREVTVQVKHPAGRQVTVRTRETARSPRSGQPKDDEATRVLRTVDPDADPDRTRVLGPGRTQAITPGRPDEEFSQARTHGTRIRGWKRSVVAAFAVFALSMAGITAFELISGNDLSGGRGTTVGSVVRGGERDADPSRPDPADSTGAEQDGGQEATPDSGSSTTPATPPGDQPSGEAPAPGRSDSSSTGSVPEPSGSGGSATTTAPTEAPEEGETAGPEPTGAGESGAPGPDVRATQGAGTGR